MDGNYKLINSVDPTKCRAQIRERFAKLTLSSNKKKRENAEMHPPVKEQVLHSNVSRNLLSELLTDDESDGGKQQNLLLRTDSSPSDVKSKKSLNSTDFTHCSEAERDVEKSQIMDPLRVSAVDNSEGPTDTEDEIEKLSLCVSLLAMEPAPIAIKSRDEHLEDTHIVSTEKQRLGSAQRFSDLLRAQCKKDPNISICISSSTSEDSDAPITISDSSEGEDEYALNVSTSVTTNPPPTLDLVKADRMAAFLRDVRLNYGLPVDSPDRELANRQKEIASADTEPMTETDSRSVGTGRRIATADTESMTHEENTLKESTSPKNTSNRRLALNDTEDMTRASESMESSPRYAPVMNVGTELLDDSIQKSRDSMPEDSLTIAETSEEEEETKERPERSQLGTDEALTRSNSLSQPRSKESSVSSMQDTQIKINISAKINIQIQVSQHLEESTSSDSSRSCHNDASESASSEDKAQSSAQKAMNQTNAVEDVPHSPPEQDAPHSPPEQDVPHSPPEQDAPHSPPEQKHPEEINKSPDDFMQTAQRLLNELYGNNWKTPEVMRSLKKATGTARKKAPVTDAKSAESNVFPKDESGVDDFSMFRRNIPQDLESTRLLSTPVSTFRTTKAIATDSKAFRRPRNFNEEEIAMKTLQDPVTKTKSGREVRHRWRATLNSDSESEGANASEDLDKSWSRSDEDAENKNRTRLPRVRRDAPKTDLSGPKNDDGLVYLDLSKDEVEVQHNVSASPPANHDEKFNRRLEEILKTCKFEDKPKILSTPATKTKRKLFTPKVDDDDDNLVAAPFGSPKEQQSNIDKDEQIVSISHVPMPSKFQPFNKYLESVKTGKPIFKIQTPKVSRERDVNSTPSVPKTPKSTTKELRTIHDLCATPSDKYGFLRSLDVCVAKSRCHPDALYYRDNFRLKKTELADKLYEIYNRQCFNDQLKVPIQWNKKLTNTAGRCMNKKRMGERTCVIELSEKVLTSADRLRCTLIHELCHAATWVLNGEGGHGATWKAWARKANQVFPEIPKIGVCHQYDIEYKYTYKCTLCAAKSHAHSKSKKVENIRCSYCHGAIEVFLNKKDKEGNIIAMPVREPTGFAKFVKEKYKKYKRPDLKHAEVMKLLSNEFASLKVDGKS